MLESEEQGRGQSEALVLRRLALAGVFSALVFAATLVSISTPLTQGYFNLGESMIYTAAALGGPWVAMVAGGLGSALADLYLGYGQYAPGTLVIKAVEGFLAGFIYARLVALGPQRLKRLALIMGAMVAFALMVAGLFLYGGIYGGSTVLELWGRSIEFRIPMVAWVALGLAVGGFILYFARRGTKTGLLPLATLAAGLEMVAGYFLYEAIVLGYGITAAAEIPVNIGQVVMGTVIAVFVVGSLERSGARIATQA